MLIIIFRAMKITAIIYILFCFYSIDALSIESSQSHETWSNGKYYKAVCEDILVSDFNSARCEKKIADKIASDINFIDASLRNIEQRKNQIKAEEQQKLNTRICEHFLCGHEWFFASSQEFMLKAEVPILAPSREWSSSNCQILVTEIKEKEVNIRVVPDRHPIFGDVSLKECTWQAHFWLAPRFLKKSHSGRSLDDIKEELDICEINLKLEKKKLSDLIANIDR